MSTRLLRYIFIPIAFIIGITVTTYSILQINELNTLQRGQELSALQYLVPQLASKVIARKDKEIDALCQLSVLNNRFKTLVVFDKNKRVISLQGDAGIFNDRTQIENKFTEHLDYFSSNYGTRYLIAPIPDKDELFEHINFNIKSKNKLSVPDPVGWLLIGIDGTNKLIKLHNLLIVGSFLILLSGLFGWLLYLYIVRKYLYPYKQINDVLGEINKGDLQAINQLPVSSIFLPLTAEIKKCITHLESIEQELSSGIELANSDLQGHLETLEERNIQLCMSIKQLKELSKSKSEFIATMSHEIRTPINGIIGFANILKETELSAMQSEYAEVIKNSAQNLTHIINDILDYTKIEAGELSLEVIPFEIRNCIDEVLMLMYPIIDKKKLNTYVTTSHQVPMLLKGDPTRFKQILTNLISNAVKFTECGSIEIFTMVANQSDSKYQIEISVIDSGIGLSQKEKSKLFNTFKQANNSIQRKFGGTGLGLIITQRLVEKMSGNITVHSDIGNGSTFKISIQLDAVQQNSTYLKGDYPNKNIWIYDKDARSRKGIEETLALFKISPKFFETAKEAEIHINSIDYLMINISSKEGIGLYRQILPTIGDRYLCYYHGNEPSQVEGARNRKIRAPINLQKWIEIFTSNESLSPKVVVKPKNIEQRNILIAEDDPVNQFLVRSILSRHHVSYTIVDNGTDLVHQASEKPFDLLLLDMQMPKLDGLDAAKQVRRPNQTNSNTPIITVSANFTETQKQECYGAGISEIILKPFDEKRLIQTIKLWTPRNEDPIKWPICMKSMGGRSDHAKTIINEFIQELRHDLFALKSCIKKRDKAKFLAIIHRNLGSTGYVGVPKLKHYLKEIEIDAAENRFTLTSHVEAIEQLFLAMNDVLNYFDNEFKYLI